MITISCFGHWDIFDENITEKMECALEKLFLLDDAFQFLFIPQLEGIEKICLKLVHELAMKHSDKKITTTLAGWSNQFENLADFQEIDDAHYLALWKLAHPNLCSKFDHVVLPLGFKQFSDGIAEGRRLRKWVIQNTNVLLSYEYTNFSFEKQQIHALIEKKVKNGTLKIIDLTVKSTEDTILKLLPILTEQERLVRIHSLEGKSKKEIAELLGVSYERVRQIQYHIGRRLREALAERLKNKEE